MTETKIALKPIMDSEANNILGCVNTFADQYKSVITRTRDGKKQFVDLVEAAAQACCVDEFKLYIRYKGAKEGTRGLWGALSRLFNAVIDEKLIDSIVPNVEKKLVQQNPDIVVNEERHEDICLEVLRRFCGYLMWRAHVDITSEGGGDYDL